MRFAAAALALLTLTLIAATTAADAQAPTSYPFRVRGVRNMDIRYETSKIKGFKRVVIRFVPAPHAAPQGLRPGQGAWLDRSLRPGEPVVIVEDVPEDKQCCADYLNSAGNYWTFYMYNTNRGYYQVTRSHYGVPHSL